MLPLVTYSLVLPGSTQSIFFSLFLRLSEYKTGGMVRMADRFAVFFTPLDESLYFSEFTVVYIFKAPSKS